MVRVASGAAFQDDGLLARNHRSRYKEQGLAPFDMQNDDREIRAKSTRQPEGFSVSACVVYMARAP